MFCLPGSFNKYLSVQPLRYEDSGFKIDKLARFSFFDGMLANFSILNPESLWILLFDLTCFCQSVGNGFKTSFGSIIDKVVEARGR